MINRNDLPVLEHNINSIITLISDFGQYNPASPNYYVAMFLHNQEIDISKNIEFCAAKIIADAGSNASDKNYSSVLMRLL